MDDWNSAAIKKFFLKKVAERAKFLALDFKIYLYNLKFEINFIYYLFYIFSTNLHILDPRFTYSLNNVLFHQ
jgi:hypothetical protein